MEQKQAFVKSLLELKVSRTKCAADVAIFTNAVEEQSKTLERLIELNSLFDDSVIIAQCEQCRANICPTQLDYCQPISNFLALIICPPCSMKADLESA